MILVAAEIFGGEQFRQADDVRSGLGRVGDTAGGLFQGGGHGFFRGHLDKADGKRTGHESSLPG
jgi:hypothetical protein